MPPWMQLWLACLSRLWAALLSLVHGNMPINEHGTPKGNSLQISFNTEAMSIYSFGYWCFSKEHKSSRAEVFQGVRWFWFSNMMRLKGTWVLLSTFGTSGLFKALNMMHPKIIKSFWVFQLKGPNLMKLQFLLDAYLLACYGKSKSKITQQKYKNNSKCLRQGPEQTQITAAAFRLPTIPYETSSWRWNLLVLVPHLLCVVLLWASKQLPLFAFEVATSLMLMKSFLLVVQ